MKPFGEVKEESGMNRTPIVIICGPTASGKSRVALNLAKRYGGVIINADSLQVYKDIPIATAQPSLKERDYIPHKLYGHIPCNQHYSVNAWLSEVISEINLARVTSCVPILVGGTGMYLSALVYGMNEIPDVSKEVREDVLSLLEQKGLGFLHSELIKADPDAASRIHHNDTQRTIRALEVFYGTGKPLLGYWQKQPKKQNFPVEDFLIVKIEPERNLLYSNCNARFDIMLEDGLLEEVKFYQEKYGNPQECPAIGIPQIASYLAGSLTMEQAVYESKKLTRHYAKRQFLWFRKHLKWDFRISQVEQLDGLYQYLEKCV